MSPLITRWFTGLALRCLFWVLLLNFELKVEVRRISDAYEVGFIFGGMCTPCNPTIEHLYGEKNIACSQKFPAYNNNQHQGSLSGSMFGSGIESDPWEFLLLFAILGVHCIAGQWLCMAVPPRIYYSERWTNFIKLNWTGRYIVFCSRKDDFLMITNDFLPWKSRQLRVTEGDIVHAPTKSDVLKVNSWKHLLGTPHSKRLFIGKDHFQSDWIYRKLLGTHFESSDSVPPWRRG